MNRYPRLREETERIITTYIREKEQACKVSNTSIFSSLRQCCGAGAEVFFSWSRSQYFGSALALNLFFFKDISVFGTKYRFNEAFFY